MGLGKSFSSMANNSIKLGELHAVPTTEDLLFVLTTATKNKKTAELPFKNPYTGLTFSIKVAPATLQKPPRWTFARCSESGDVVLWTRDSNEIMMIQGKVKIESNYSGVSLEEPQIEPEAQAVREGIEEEAAPPQQAPWEKGIWHDSQWQQEADQEAMRQKEAEFQAPWQNTQEEEQAIHKAADPGAVWQNAPEHQAAYSQPADSESRAQDETWTAEPGAEEARAAESRAAESRTEAEGTEHSATEATSQKITDKKPKSKKAAARAAKAAAKAAAAQATLGKHPAVPETLKDATQPATEESSVETSSDLQLEHQISHDPIAVPPPVTLHPEVLTNYLSSLSDPATGLLYHGAFEFFLLRDSEYSQKHGLKLSLLVFDFVNSQSTEQASLSTGTAAIMGRIMSEYCTPMVLCTQLRTGEFAMLLCGYDGAGALNFAENLCTRLPREHSELGTLGDLKPLAMGVASMPEHCQDPGTLIATAIAAKNLARQWQLSCMLFPSPKTIA